MASERLLRLLRFLALDLQYIYVYKYRYTCVNQPIKEHICIILFRVVRSADDGFLDCRVLRSRFKGTGGGGGGVPRGLGRWLLLWELCVGMFPLILTAP